MRTQKIAVSGLIICLTLTGLLLTTGCAGTQERRSTGAYLDDKSIGTRVKTALFRDSMVSGFDVGVNTFRGEVQLNGFVDTDEQRMRAEELAMSVPGVRTVLNNLEVKPVAAMGAPGQTVEGGTGTIGQPVVESPALDGARATPAPQRFDSRERPLTPQPSDERFLDADRPLDAPLGAAPAAQEPIRNLEIEVNNGRAIIRGEVNNPSQSQAVERSVRQIPGVQQIENQLEIQAPLNR